MKQPPKIQQTKRKYYNKWLYKLTFRLPGSRLVSFYDFNTIINLLNRPLDVSGNFLRRGVDDALTCKEDWLKFLFLLNQIPKDEYQKRIEHDLFSVYTNNKKFIEAVKCDLFHCLTEIFEPDSSTQDLLNTEENVIIVNKLPYDKYNFRVIIRPHKLTPSQREQLINFLENSPGIGLQESVKSFIRTNDINWDKRYVYVDTEQTLTLLRLTCSDAVSTIHRYIINDK